MKINFTSEDNIKLERFSEEYMLGVLVNEDDELLKSKEYNAINSRDEGNIVDFYIKPLSPEFQLVERINKTLITSDYYIGQSTRNENVLGIDRYFEGDKKKRIKEVLEKKLILFKPNITIKKNEYSYFNDNKIYKNIKIEKILGDYLNDSSYIKVVEIFENNLDFENKLRKGEIEIKELIMEKPVIILCRDYLYDFSEATWEEKESESNIFKLNPKSKVYKKALNHESNLFIKTLNKNLYFIEEDLFYNSEKFQSGRIEIDLNSLKNKNSNEYFSLMDEYIEENKESLFIKKLSNYCMNQGLFYQNKDLVNFHICLKTNYLTILAGMSGTGKSKLARLYSDLLGNSSNERLLFAPISPSYTEPSDLLGYYNPTTCLYQSSDTGLVDFIIKASNDKNNLYFIIFDEMNLAQIEHWFAPFISIMEEKNEDNRILRLYNDKLNCINDCKYPPSVIIGDNIRFIGTINLDETSKDISDRVLDRSNIIRLEKMNFIDCKKILSLADVYEDIEDLKIDYNMFNSWIEKEGSFDTLGKLSDSELLFFDELHKIISKYDSQKGVSFRVLEQIGNYLNNIPKNSKNELLITRSEAFDIQITQRILSKLKGNIETLGELLGSYNFSNKELEDSTILSIFEDEKYNTISEFEKAKNEIIKKAKEISVYGYTN